jgi:colicin import membrane protein
VSAQVEAAGWGSLSLSVMLHLTLALIAAVTLWWVRPAKLLEQRLAIEAVVVTRSAARASPLPPQPVDNAAQRAAEQKALEVARQHEAAEARRLVEERQEAERKTQAAAAERVAAEQERIAREKEAREKAAREKLEHARARREAELNAQIAAEERLSAARASGEMAQYIAQITARIERAWIRPASAVAGLDCEVRVTQVPGGAVTAVQVGRCNGDASVRESIEAAVLRASPLPQPANAALFERNLVVTFRPEN